MDIPLLSTKLFVPSTRPGLVMRPRLMERLEAGLTGPLTLVSAPAGFGKTTVLSQWIATHEPPRPVAWIQLDEGDNDPVRFWDYFIAAVKKLQPGAGENAATMLHSPQAYAIEAVLTTLINDLTTVPEGITLVMDDYHRIKTDAIHAAMAFLIDHCPSGIHLAIATRADPPFPLPHFRGRSTLVEIGADDLRFTSREADDLLKLQDVVLNATDLGALNGRAEGWAVGLKMAALAMRGRQDGGEFVASFTGSQRYIMDYLVEEVLTRQPQDVRDFLLSTSVLERITAALCDALTGLDNSRSMLERLERSNLFLVPLDDSRRWYRYHHLFGDLLRHQLEISEGEERVKQLHRMAGEWYQAHDLVDDAVHHALAARDWERAVKIVGKVAEGRLKQGEIVTLFEWLGAVPQSYLIADLDLYRHYCRALAGTGHLEAAEAALQHLQFATRVDSNLEGEVAYLRADAAIRSGRVDLSIQLAEKAVSLLNPDNGAYLCLANFRAGFGQHHRGSLSAAQDHLTESLMIAQQIGDRNTAAWSANFLAAVLHQQGKMRKALELAKRGLQIAGQSTAAAGPYCRLSMIPYEMNDLDIAVRNAQLAAEWNRLAGDSASVVGYIYVAMAKLAAGDTAGAVEAMLRCDLAVQDPKIMRLFHARHVVGHVMFAVR